VPDEAISDLVRQLLRVRGVLAADAPGSPAWAAAVEWSDELEAQIRSMGRDPEVVDRTAKAARPRPRSGSDGYRIERIPAGPR
jgi:hypothetical protein